MRGQRGIAIVELLVAVLIAAMVMAVLATATGSLQRGDALISERLRLQRDARLALDRIAAITEGSTHVLIPLEVTTASRDVLAVALPPGLDRNGDGFADADNDKNGVVDDDLPADETNDGGAGVIGIDDDGDGLVDNGASFTDNDENGTIGSAPVAPKTGADWIDAVVYYRVGSQLMERLPNISPFNGNDFSVRPIADNVTAFSVTRVPTGNRRQRELIVKLALTGPGGETGSWMRRLRVGVR